METLSKVSERKQTALTGKWALVYKTMNSQGPEAFGGFTISPFKNPITGKKVHLRDPDGNAKSWYMVSKLRTDFDPSNNIQDLLILQYLILHPEVQVKGFGELHPKLEASKNGNSNMVLTALDYVEEVELQEEDYIDKLIGLISLDLGKNALSFIKIQQILSALNRPYTDNRAISKGSTAKQKIYLRSKLKKFARSSYANAKLVNAAIENLEENEDQFQIKEMIRLGVITEVNSMYKYDSKPIGIGTRGIIDTFHATPELKVEMLRALEEKKKEIQ